MTIELVLVRRMVAADADLLPGEYRQILRKHLHGAVSHCVWRCTYCKGLGSLRRSVHAIDHEGVVTPGVMCPNCDQNNALVLADWVPESAGSA